MSKFERRDKDDTEPASVCKILYREDLERAIRNGKFSGSPHDLSDGFLHFSAEDQLAGTLAKHYRDASELWLLRVNVDALRDDLRFEVSRGGQRFPHLYAELRMEDVESIQPIRLERADAVHPVSIRRKILYLHGWTSVVGGVKPTSLIEAGHDVIEPALDDDDFDLALKVAQAACEKHRPELVVGSSRGGALAVNLELPPEVPRIVLCPAWRRWGNANRVPINTLILHSPFDDVIPFSDSLNLIENSSLFRSHLRVVGSDHRLASPDAITALKDACLEFPDRRFDPFAL